MSNKKDFLDFVFKCLHKSGLGPKSPKWKRLFSLCVLLPMSMIVISSVFYDFLYINGDIFKIAALMESTSSFLQLIIRKIILLMRKSLLVELLELRKSFWDYDAFGKEFGEYVRKKIILAIYVVKTMIILGSGTALLLCLSAILDPAKSVPLESYVPETPKIARYYLFMSNVFVMIELMCLLGAVDGFFVAMCVETKIQLILLRRKISLIPFGKESHEKCLQELTACVQHHNLLLRVHSKLNDIFSEYFLAQYGLTILATCTQLYILMYIPASFEVLAKCVVYLAATLFQVAMFFIPASDVEAEAEKLAVEIYDVQWEDHWDKRMRQNLLFMLKRSQQPLAMMGGGMVYINRNEYVAIFKMSFSIATLLGGFSEAAV